MRIYFSGIGGVGIGPLAEIALDANHDVSGSDPATSLMTHELAKRGVTISQNQSGEFLRRQHAAVPIDWVVYTVALPADHPELVLARKLGIHTTKRDELLAHIITEKNLKLIAIAGTHGKTTTTGMLVWTLQQLGIPVSYSIGTTLNWGPSGHFDPLSEYFVYECDEFDRNFLHFSPYLSLITAIDYDHPDTYPTKAEYHAAFSEFIAQSQQTIMWQHDAVAVTTPENAWLLGDNEVQDIKLAGAHNRRNATLVAKGIEYLAQAGGVARVAARGAAPEILSDSDEKFLGADELTGPADNDSPSSFSEDSAFPAGASQERQLNQIAASGSEKNELSGSLIRMRLESFPGTNRRFEKLADNLYSDYGHHPNEIQATLQMARELSEHIVLIYQPHQNIRQHEIRDQYTGDIFADADEVYWLPTYLSREDPNLEILTPQQLTTNLDQSKVHLVNLDETLWQAIENARDSGALVLAMGAGTIDGWLRQRLT